MPQASRIPPDDLYERDIVLWAEEQAQRLRQGRLETVDLGHVIETVDGIGAARRNAIETRLKALVTRLLMWKYMPGARLPSWRTDIGEERDGIARLVRTAPSLAGHADHVFDECYRAGRLRAAAETGIDFTLFPDTPPFGLDQVLGPEFLPEQPDDQTC